ncbi:MAG: hypothetical protein ACR2RV_07375 [Verrucomicrobiales bacterium]
MSLKGFHIVFITLSTLCLVGFAVWTFASEVGVTVRATGALSALLGVGLAVYGSWFYRNKLKDSSL